MMKPIFSVILVTYKRVDFLNRAIDCILNQSFRNFELLIFNDAPEDNEIVGRLIDAKGDKRIQFTPSTEARGANFWRNLGIKNARGKYVAFLDDDDLWKKSKLLKHYRAHEENKAFMVFSNYFMTWPDENRPDRLEENARIVPDLIGAIAAGEFSISTTSSVSVRNEIEGNLFDESLSSFQDWDAWFSLILNKRGARLHRIDEPLLYFMQHNKARVSKNIERREAALYQLKNKYESLGIDIAGFVYKQKLNLLILQLQNSKASKQKVILSFLSEFVRQPQLLAYKYTYKRVGRFIFNNH